MNLKNKVFDLADVSLHNNSKDCWVIINARVYDVTNFLKDHPGGDNVLLDVAGKEASEEFEEAGHGSAARLMLDEYYIGEIDLVTPTFDIYTATNPKTTSQPKKQVIMQDDIQSESGVMMKSYGFLLPLALLVVAIGFLMYK